MGTTHIFCLKFLKLCQMNEHRILGVSIGIQLSSNCSKIPIPLATEIELCNFWFKNLKKHKIKLFDNLILSNKKKP